MKTFQRCDQITSGYHTGMIIYMTNVILINSAVYIKSFYCSLNPDNVWPVSDCFHPSVIMNNFSPRCNINRGFGTTLTRQQNLLYLSIALHIDNPLFSWSQPPPLLFGLVLMIRFTATLSEEMEALEQKNLPLSITRPLPEIDLVDTLINTLLSIVFAHFNYY